MSLFRKHLPSSSNNQESQFSSCFRRAEIRKVKFWARRSAAAARPASKEEEPGVWGSEDRTTWLKRP